MGGSGVEAMGIWETELKNGGDGESDGGSCRIGHESRLAEPELNQCRTESRGETHPIRMEPPRNRNRTEPYPNRIQRRNASDPNGTASESKPNRTVSEPNPHATVPNPILTDPGRTEVGANRPLT